MFTISLRSSSPWQLPTLAFHRQPQRSSSAASCCQASTGCRSHCHGSVETHSPRPRQLPVQVRQCGGWCPAVLCAVFTIVPRTVARPGTFFATSFVMHLAQGITSTTYEVAPQSLAHLTGLPGPSTPAYWHRHPGTALRCVGINALAYRSAGCCAIWVASGSPCTPWPGLWRVSHDCGLIGTQSDSGPFAPDGADSN